MFSLPKTNLAVKSELSGELRVCKIELQGDIVVIHVHPSAEVEPDDVTEIHKTIVEFKQGQRIAILIVAHMPFHVTPLARNAITAIQEGNRIIAGAVYTELTTVRMMVNFFNRIDRPRIPVKVFNSREEAYSWLREQLLSEVL
jgi:hypothetical protein